jgi:hypothetical protein
MLVVERACILLYPAAATPAAGHDDHDFNHQWTNAVNRLSAFSCGKSHQALWLYS